MATINYAEQFSNFLAQKYEAESKSFALTQSNLVVTFINAQTIKLPRLTLSGYKDHTRTVGFNAGTISNDWEAKKLSFDRDVEFFVDPMDIDETNLALAVANIQNVFEEEQAIPETDAYRFSKIYTDFTGFGKSADTTSLTAANVLEWFDSMMSGMDDEGVPEEGRILYVTPAVNKLLKEADGISRMVTISAGTAGVISRSIHNIDDVEIVSVPSARMKSAYDFTEGFKAASTAKQINAILVHPNSVVAREKYSYIHLYTPGTDSRTADGYVYQNRKYQDLFVLEKRASGIAINANA